MGQSSILRSVAGVGISLLVVMSPSKSAGALSVEENVSVDGLGEAIASAVGREGGLVVFANG